MALFKTAPITTDPLEILKYFSDMKASKGDKKRDGIMADSGFVGEETDTASLDWLASTFDKFREAKDNAKIDLETRRTSEKNLALRDKLGITQSRDRPYGGSEDLDKLRMQMNDLGIAKRNGLPAQPEIEEVAMPEEVKPKLTTDILLKMLKETKTNDTEENVDAISNASDDPYDESTFGEATAPVGGTAPVEGTEVSTGEGLMSKRKIDELPYSKGIVEGSTEKVLLETQSRLKELGFYGGKVDGITGLQTRSAIKTFQHKNDLPVTGTADDQTRLKLADSKGLVSQPKPQTTLLSFISDGEGGYGAVNNPANKNVPKANQKFVPNGYYSDNYNKPLTEMTVNEIMNAQVGTTGKTTKELLNINPKSVTSQKNRELFAVGAYQIIPATMWSAVRKGAIDANDIFSPEVQDKISMVFLAGSDRPKLRDFLSGDPNVSVDEAALSLAKQWASVPVTKTQTVTWKNVDGTTGSKKVIAGKSYYDKVGKNSATHTAAETKAMLLQARKDAKTLVISSAGAR